MHTDGQGTNNRCIKYLQLAAKWEENTNRVTNEFSLGHKMIKKRYKITKMWWKTGIADWNDHSPDKKKTAESKERVHKCKTFTSLPQNKQKNKQTEYVGLWKQTWRCNMTTDLMPNQLQIECNGFFFLLFHVSCSLTVLIFLETNEGLFPCLGCRVHCVLSFNPTVRDLDSWIFLKNFLMHKNCF